MKAYEHSPQGYKQQNSIYSGNQPSMHQILPSNTKSPFNRKIMIQKSPPSAFQNSKAANQKTYRFHADASNYHDLDNPEASRSQNSFQYPKIESTNRGQYYKSHDILPQGEGLQQPFERLKANNRDNHKHGQKTTWNIMENNFKHQDDFRTKQNRNTQDILKKIRQCLSPSQAQTSCRFKATNQTAKSKLSSYEQESTKSSTNTKLVKTEQLENERWRSNTNVFSNLMFLKNKNHIEVNSSQKQRKRSIEPQRNVTPSKILSKFLSQSNLIPYQAKQHSQLKPLSVKDFALVKVVGEGRYGTVFQAIHKHTGSLYALKRVSKSAIKKHSIQKQLMFEVKYQTLFDHPNIVKMYGCFADQEFVYFIIEYMEGGNLFDLLKTQNKVLPEVEVSQIVGDVGSAISYLQGMAVAHRDIKPENIVRSYGINKLCDFGWVVNCANRRRTCCGTLGYVAPEVLEGRKYDHSIDLWGLGVLTYQLTTGQLPFKQKSSKQSKREKENYENIWYPPSMSVESRSFIESLIRKDPGERVGVSKLLKHQFLINARARNYSFFI